MKAFAKKIFGLAASLLVAAAGSGQTYSIVSFTIAGGSGTATAAQPDGSLELREGAS